MDEKPAVADSSAVLVGLTVSENSDKQSPTSVVFIPVLEENGGAGKLGGSNPLLSSSSGRLLQTINGALIAFRDVSCQVETTVRTHACRCRKEPKHILKNARSV